jgi:hypothetical protein
MTHAYNWSDEISIERPPPASTHTGLPGLPGHAAPETATPLRAAITLPAIPIRSPWPAGSWRVSSPTRR